ncbi:hypothetical protein [Parvibaculum sp.]|jgi:hypothetical protein|uniref:hypothetical protein n=1 Tax=Parvibaculum sp. TaxID=2024848 RepID=UPI0025FF8F57|nr:hypothetical protein [Parvibaculum sp.]
MSIRKKSILFLSVGVINIFGLLVAALAIHEAFLFLALVALFVLGICQRSFLKCPSCRHPILKRTVVFFGEPFTYWGLPPQQCPHCGEDLRQDR